MVLIADVRFDRPPSPWQVHGVRVIAPASSPSTFDDGPDPVWTSGCILDVLKANQVHAPSSSSARTGSPSAACCDGLLAEGHDVGSHTYTHRNLARATPRETALELKHHSAPVPGSSPAIRSACSAPYFGDAEPSTADEVGPVYAGQQLGYLSVGLHVDPNDWKRPGVQAIINDTIQGVEDSSPERSGNIVLLHDSGGDRAQTLAALPAIIRELKARGYRFVTVSELAGIPHGMANPPISSSDRLAAQADLGLFLFLGWTTIALKWLFMVAITLGILRAISLSALALIQARRDRAPSSPPSIPVATSPC